MQIKQIETSRINPAAYNPRIDLQQGDPEYESLKKSINEFGYIEPLVWNEATGNLVGGHQRFKILMEDHPDSVFVSVVNLSDEKEKALNIALNKIGGDWDEDKLGLLLADLQTSDIDLELTGFDEESINEYISQVKNDTEEFVEEDDFDFEETVQDLKQNEAETVYGDVWQLGRHLLVCGDATNRADVQKLVEKRKADLIITDPPYNVAVKSDGKVLNTDGHSSILNDDMEDDQFVDFLNDIFREYSYVMNDSAGIYVFHPSSYQREFENAMNASNIVVRSQCIWVKNAATFGWAQYRFKHEPVFYAFKKGKTPAWYGDRKQTTVWRAGLPVEEQEPDTIWEVSRGDVSKYIHPTQKPLELASIPLKNSSKKGDYVIDFFGGSGWTLMSCDQLGRDCGMLELDPYFCDAIKIRFEKATGIKPVLLKRDQ